MTEIDEYEAMQEDEPAAQPSESPDEKSQTEELLPMLHYMSGVLDQLKEAATALQEEREKLQTYGSRLKEITAVLSAEAAHLQEFQTATLQNMEQNSRSMFYLTAKNFEKMAIDAQKWQKNLLKKQTPRLEILGTATYVVLLLVIVDICVHIYFR